MYAKHEKGGPIPAIAVLTYPFTTKSLPYLAGPIFPAGARISDRMTTEQLSRITGHKSQAVFEEYADHITLQRMLPRLIFVPGHEQVKP
jgi:hypothetical protein